MSSIVRNAAISEIRRFKSLSHGAGRVKMLWSLHIRRGAVLVALLIFPAVSNAQAVYVITGDVPRAFFDGKSQYALLLSFVDIGCKSPLGCIDRAKDIGRLLDLELARYPVSAPAGGFTFTFDSRARAWLRNSDSFGPSFAERPLTNGRHVISFGSSTQSTQFATWDGIDLHSLLLQSNALHDRNAPPYSATTESVNLNITSSVVSVFATYGLTDRMDVSVVVPYKRLTVQSQVKNVTVNCTFGPCNAGIIGSQNTETVVSYNFIPPLTHTTTGIGDTELRFKYQWLKRDRFHAGSILDLSFPTGTAEDFLGAGKLAMKVMFLASAIMGPASPHLNVDYVQGGTALQTPPGVASPGINDRNREVGVAAGLEWAMGSRVTVAGDVLSRFFLDVGPLQQQNTSIVPPFASPGTVTEDFSADAVVGGRAKVLLGDVGLKINLMNRFIVKGDVLFPITSNGLQGRWTPVVGMDYTF